MVILFLFVAYFQNLEDRNYNKAHACGGVYPVVLGVALSHWEAQRRTEKHEKSFWEGASQEPKVKKQLLVTSHRRKNHTR